MWKRLHQPIAGKTEIVKLLLKHYNSEESGLNVKGEYGMTPFIVACYNGHNDVVKLLLDHSEGNIDFNARSYSGWTAFELACFKGQKDVVKLLLEYAKAKGIQIPRSQSILFGNISDEIMDDIKNLIDEYQEEN